MNTTVEHAREILLRPKQEWMRIEKEPTSVGDLYRFGGGQAEIHRVAVLRSTSTA
jgi:hypothetical protein